jgi:hypothetical protein
MDLVLLNISLVIEETRANQIVLCLGQEIKILLFVAAISRVYSHEAVG